eukprot:1582686-Pleurochrysis_carterae.AAC.1
MQRAATLLVTCTSGGRWLPRRLPRWLPRLLPRLLPLRRERLFGMIVDVTEIIEIIEITEIRLFVGAHHDAPPLARLCQPTEPPLDDVVAPITYDETALIADDDGALIADHDGDVISVGAVATVGPTLDNWRASGR